MLYIPSCSSIVVGQPHRSAVRDLDAGGVLVARAFRQHQLVIQHYGQFSNQPVDLGTAGYAGTFYSDRHDYLPPRAVPAHEW